MAAPPSSPLRRAWRRPAAALACAAGLVGLAACGCTPLREYIDNGFKVGPNYGRPPAPVARRWIDADDVRVRQSSDDLSRWWAVFNDPVLDGLVRYAYGQNLTLRQAGFRVLQSRAQLGVAIGNFFPQQQGALGDYTRYGLSVEDANRNFIPRRWYGQWDIGLGVAWELDFWGRYRRAIEASEDDLDASVESYDDVLVTLLADVASSYVQLRTTQAQIEFTKENAAIQRKTLTIVEAKFKAGFQRTTEVDVDQARSNLAQTEALVPQLEIQLRQAGDRLCVLLGVPPEDVLPKVGAAPIPTSPTEVAAGIPADLISRRPDVRRAERQAAAESARIGIFDSDFYPHIILNGNLGWSAEHLDKLFTQRALTGTFGPSFQWSLLNYGRILNSVRAQDARFQEAVAGYQSSVLRAAEEVEDGLITFLKAQERAKYLAVSAGAAKSAVKIGLVQFEAGTIAFNQLALLEQNLVQQQNQLAEAQGEIALGLIQVYRALGGGWQIRCDTPPLPPDAAGAEVPSTPAPAPAPAPAQPPEDK